MNTKQTQVREKIRCFFFSGEDPVPVIFGLPDPVLFSPDSDPTYTKDI